MSNYIEYNNEVAFHPGYYIKEIVDESGLTQEDFAKRLGTTPKNLSILIRGEQSLSIDIAAKLSRMLRTTTAYWLGLQKAYDEKVAEFLSEEELKREKTVLRLIDYSYFQDNFGLPNLPRRKNEKVKCLREFLGVHSLTALEEQSLAVSFRSYSANMSKSNIVNANAMVQIAVNQTLKKDLPRYDKKKFQTAVSFALTQTKNHNGFLEMVSKAFQEAGVDLVVLPNWKNSGINGATKKVDGKVMLMVNDRRHYADTFWFTMFHEVGHILKGDFGVSFKGEEDDDADRFAQNILIPEKQYKEFVGIHQVFNEEIITEFADSIAQDPGIVLGRLQKDGMVPYTDTELSRRLRHTYTIVTGNKDHNGDVSRQWIPD